jgi:hypothetical protein
VVKVRDGQVANRPFYAAIGVTVEGHKEILGLWPGTPGEGEGYGTSTGSFGPIPVLTWAFTPDPRVVDIQGLPP